MQRLFSLSLRQGCEQASWSALCPVSGHLDSQEGPCSVSASTRPQHCTPDMCVQPEGRSGEEPPGSVCSCTPCTGTTPLGADLTRCAQQVPLVPVHKQGVPCSVWRRSSAPGVRPYIHRKARNVREVSTPRQTQPTGEGAVTQHRLTGTTLRCSPHRVLVGLSPTWQQQAPAREHHLPCRASFSMGLPPVPHSCTEPLT